MRRALLAAGVLALCLPAAAAGDVAPLPESDYQTRPACPAPAPGHAGCLALRLVPLTAAARARTHPLGMTSSAAIRAGSAADGADGLRPADLRSAYFPGEPPDAPSSAPQTIALVDAYNDPSAEADLGVYDREFGLPPCTAEDKCFKKVNQLGETGRLPSAVSAQEKEEASGWALEISTDIEIAHAVCQNCRILLVEANSGSYADLETAEDTAVRLGATEISNSWGGAEPAPDSPAFNHPKTKTVITAAAGDDGYLNWTGAEEAGEERYVGADYPASSPHVVAVGGTKLTLEAGARARETVWNEDPDPEGGNEGAGGGGCSTQFTAPPWQQAVADWASVGCGTGTEAKRAVADIAADADPYTGVAVYDSVPYEEEGRAAVLHWVPIGGTSVASPIVASMFAITDGPHEVEYPAQTLYSHLGSPSLYDVTEGGNGKCDGLYTGVCSGSMEPLSPLFPFDCGSGALICNAAPAPGYDGPTGVGAPNGLAAFEPGSEAEHSNRVQARKAAEQKAEEERTAEEKLKARKAEEEAAARAAEAKKAEEARKAEEERLAAEKLKEEEEEEARNGSGGGSTGKGGGGGATTSNSTGAGQLTAGSEDGQLSGFPSGTSTGSGGSVRTPVRLTHLALTARARAAIARSLPTLSQVAFAFTLSAPARVRVTLSRQVVVHGRPRWVPVPGALTLAAGGGRDRAHLRGRRTLAPGRYRLTLTPARGGARACVFALR
jgi:hypothetical protein